MHGGKVGQWDTEITDSCRGVVRVQWHLAGRPPVVHQWDVVVSSNQIFAASESPSGKRLLQLFHEQPGELPPLDLSGSTTDAGPG